MPIRLEGITLYTVKDIEELLGVGNSTVRRYIGEGRLQGRKMARRWYIPAQNLLDYFRQSEMEPPTELLEKLQELEETLDKKETRPRPRQKISLARIASGHAPRKAEAPPPPPRVEPAPPPPPPIISASDTDVEKLLAQARRLKEEAARIEKLYVGEGELPDSN